MLKLPVDSQILARALAPAEPEIMLHYDECDELIPDQISLLFFEISVINILWA
jgi:hypothetical protein